jgi:hypothetical protein
MFLKIVEGLEIDVCPVCKGVWFDRSELDLLLLRQRKRAQAVRIFQKQSWMQTTSVAPASLDALGELADLGDLTQVVIELLSSH